MDVGADGRPLKRSRGAGGAVDPRRRGMFASMRFGKAQPWSTYGAMRVQRGTPENIARFGASARAATAEQKALRKLLAYSGRGRYRGRGGFWGDLWSKTAGIRSTLGAGLKTILPPAASAALTMAENAGRAAGLGAYTAGQPGTVSNDIVDGGAGQNIPTFGASGPGIIKISHKEYLGDLFGPSTNFYTRTYALNPGLVTTFPWLSQVASNYEEYDLEQCIFTFRSTLTDVLSGSGQCGTVIMATQYNADDPPFGTKQDMLEYDLAMSGKASQNLLHGVECDPAQLSGSRGKYVRDGPVPEGEDLKTYDHGILNIAVSNSPSSLVNQSLGEIWVSYTVTLRKPRFQVSRGFGIQRDSMVAAVPYGLSSVGTVPDHIGGLAQYRLTGQQNRIGGQFTFSGPDSYSYVFPNDFSGYIKSTCRLAVIRTSSSVAAQDVALNAEPVGGTSTIVPVNDILTWDINGVLGGFGASPRWTNATAVQSQSATYDTTIVIENLVFDTHWLVTPVSTQTGSTPLPNMLMLNSNLTGVMFLSIQWDVEVYNASFNHTTGTQGALVGSPILVNAVGVSTDIVPFQPA